MTQEQYEQMIQAGIDWQYLIVLSGGMARKSDLDAWLMRRFGVDECEAHGIANAIEYQHRCYWVSNGNGGIAWSEYNAHRPAPTAEQYGGMDALTHGGKIGQLHQTRM
jgi:hypothetical protein